MRCRAARRLGRLRHRPAIPLLIDLLADECPATRRAAMVALERLGETLPVTVVREVWRGNADAALLARDPRLLGALLLPLRRGDIGARCAAAAALSRLGNPHAIPDLAAALDDPIVGVRIAAAKALGHLRDPQALSPLLAALERDAPAVSYAGWDLHQAVILALGRLGDVRALTALEAALRRPSHAVWAARALATLGDPRAVPSLVDTLLTERPDIRAAAAAALGQLRDRRAEDALIPLLVDRSGMVRHTAEASLDRLGNPRAAGLARAVSSGRPGQVRDLGGRWAVHLLRALLRDPRAETRLGAARLLGEVGNPTALPDLRAQTRWWAESDVRVRHACRAAMEAIQQATGAVGSEAVPSLPHAGTGHEGAALTTDH